MFKKIKEFIKAFKDAYNTINVNKINAKTAIDNYSKDVDNIVYAADSLKIIFARLEAIYCCFPIKERQDFVQQTMDLLVYGRRDFNGGLIDICGLRGLYYSEADNGRNNLAHLNDLYNEGKYEEVITKTEEYNNRLEEFFVLYGIKEITTEENE